MQYWQRKLQRSVTDRRRSAIRRPWPSEVAHAPCPEAYPPARVGRGPAARPRVALALAAAVAAGAAQPRAAARAMTTRCETPCRASSRQRRSRTSRRCATSAVPAARAAPAGGRPAVPAGAAARAWERAPAVDHVARSRSPATALSPRSTSGGRPDGLAPTSCSSCARAAPGAWPRWPAPQPPAPPKPRRHARARRGSGARGGRAQRGVEVRARDRATHGEVAPASGSRDAVAHAAACPRRPARAGTRRTSPRFIASRSPAAPS